MKETTKISTLRANGFSVINCTGFTCLISSPIPFMYNGKLINALASQGDYRLVIRGHYKKDLSHMVSVGKE